MGLRRAWEAARNSDSPVGTFIGRSLWEGTKGLGKNTVKSYTNPYHGKPGFSLIGAGVGAGAGAMMTAMIPGGMEAASGAGAGALAGGAVLPVAGAFGALGVRALTTMYKNPIRTAGGFGGALSMGGIGAAVGSIVGPGGAAVMGGVGAAYGAVAGAVDPKAVGNLATGVLKGAGKGAGALGIGASKSALRLGNAALSVAGGILKYEPEKVFFDEDKRKIVNKRGRLRLSKAGVAKAGLLAAPLLAPSLIDKGINEVMDMRAGQNTGVVRATPSYLDNAGATGDLVFAMHQNRRG